MTFKGVNIFRWPSVRRGYRECGRGALSFDSESAPGPAGSRGVGRQSDRARFPVAIGGGKAEGPTVRVWLFGRREAEAFMRSEAEHLGRASSRNLILLRRPASPGQWAIAERLSQSGSSGVERRRSITSPASRIGSSRSGGGRSHQWRSRSNGWDAGRERGASKHRCKRPRREPSWTEHPYLIPLRQQRGRSIGGEHRNLILLRAERGRSPMYLILCAASEVRSSFS